MAAAMLAGLYQYVVVFNRFIQGHKNEMDLAVHLPDPIYSHAEIA